jgi:hypothetical protein
MDSLGISDPETDSPIDIPLEFHHSKKCEAHFRSNLAKLPEREPP